MRSAGILIASASLGGIALIAWGAMSRVSHDIDEAFVWGDVPFLPEGVRTAANSVGGLRRESGQRSSVTGSQTNQTYSTHFKPRFKTGQETL
jgi:hypothetical protein